jgi:hypothetical protein
MRFAHFSMKHFGFKNFEPIGGGGGGSMLYPILRRRRRV